MLSEEARQAIAARLGTDAASQVQEAPDKNQTQPSEDDQAPPSAEEASAEGKSDQASEDGPKEDPPKDGPSKPKDEQYVPVDKHIRLRHERNALRRELQEARELNARLEGYVKATQQGKPSKNQSGEASWLDKFLEDADKEDSEGQTNKDETPLEARIRKVEEYAAAQEAQEGKALLGQVVEACMKYDPTVPREFLVDKFAEGKTPEQALQAWQTWTKPLRSASTSGGQSQKAPEGRTAPPPPPTVNRAPQGPSNSKPTEWRDVAGAVRRALNGR